MSVSTARRRKRCTVRELSARGDEFARVRLLLDVAAPAGTVTLETTMAPHDAKRRRTVRTLVAACDARDAYAHPFTYNGADMALGSL